MIPTRNRTARPEREPGAVRTGAAALGRWTRLLTRRPAGITACALIVLLTAVALVGPWLTPDPNAQAAAPMSAPSPDHWMGTDNTGRDVLARFVAGARISLSVALLCTLAATAVGTLVGMVAALRAGTWFDALVMRATDVVMAFPLLVLVPVLSGVFTQKGIAVGPVELDNVAIMGISIGVALTPVFVRLARASALAEVRKDYMTAARGLGARRRDLVFGNLLPNIATPIVVQAAFSVAIAIIVEASVSFLGLGIQPPDASWGTLLTDARSQLLLGAWWLILFPTLGIAAAVLALTLLGDELRDLLDPRMRRGFERPGDDRHAPVPAADTRPTPANTPESR
ncbi:ABC transporter permease [Yinghuangia sp. YIM S09857]|uniref:ABC transporter permease n=1 Tax=Yinghuangia sp. YIM S09857 TaxID=3436929 RepID=UPI003F530C60